MESNQSLRDRLTQINAQIALLEGERKIIQKKLRSIIYPVLGLPFEVTSKIFVDCLPEDLEGSEPILNFPRGKPPTPLLLSQICRAWRYVALQTPKIWAMFNISSTTGCGIRHQWRRRDSNIGWTERGRHLCPLRCTTDPPLLLHRRYCSHCSDTPANGRTSAFVFITGIS